MPMTERSRAALFRTLSALTDDEEAVGEMLSQFPARDADEPATKDFVRAEIADVRAEIADVRTEIHASANRMIIWAVGSNTAMLGLVLALTRG